MDELGYIPSFVAGILGLTMILLGKKIGQPREVDSSPVDVLE